MWNDFDTGAYMGMTAETVSVPGHEGKAVPAWWSRPLGPGPFPGLILIPHMPGWDEWCREACFRFTQHGCSVLCPDIYRDYGTGRPAEVSARMREAGLVRDDSVMGDVKGCLDFLCAQPQSNGRTGVIGMCSGGRHAFLAACTVEGLDAAVDCWGGGVVMREDQLTPSRPKAPIDYTEQLKIPLLGIFGNEDANPSREEVDLTERRLKQAGKHYEFHRYDGAGHGIWYYDRPMYRQEAAMDSWNKTLDFLDRFLKGPKT